MHALHLTKNALTIKSRTDYKHHKQVFVFWGVFLEGNTGPWLGEEKGIAVKLRQ